MNLFRQKWWSGFFPIRSRARNSRRFLASQIEREHPAQALDAVGPYSS